MEVSRIMNYVVAKMAFTSYEPGIREWHLKDSEDDVAIAPSDMGLLHILPLEVRYIIYEFCCQEGSVIPLMADHSRLGIGFPARAFRLPPIAHVCHEMREEVLQKYEMISFPFQIQGPLCEKDSPSDAMWAQGRFKGAVATKVGFVQAHDVVLVKNGVVPVDDDELRVVLDHML